MERKRHKDEVLAELMAEYVTPKKSLRNSERQVSRTGLARLGRYGSDPPPQLRRSREFWLEEWEKQAILDFQSVYPHQGYRRLTYMIIAARVAAVSPSTLFRVLGQAGRLRR